MGIHLSLYLAGCGTPVHIQTYLINGLLSALADSGFPGELFQEMDGREKKSPRFEGIGGKVLDGGL